MDTLTINKLRAGYQKKAILSDLAISPIQSGQVVSLVGPNAAGKSTLLKSIAGIIPAQGEILLNQQNLLRLSLVKRSSLLGYMPQYSPNDVELNVMESLISALKSSPWDYKDGEMPEARERALDVMEEAGILHLAMESLNTLSGGQKQMVSLAQAMVRAPKMLLLDEPTSALDLHHQINVLKLVRKYADEGNIVLMVIHDLNLAVRWSDRLIILSQGTVHSDGSPKTVTTSEMLKTVYRVEARVEFCSKGCLQVMVDN